VHGIENTGQKRGGQTNAPVRERFAPKEHTPVQTEVVWVKREQREVRGDGEKDQLSKTESSQRLNKREGRGGRGGLDSDPDLETAYKKKERKALTSNGAERKWFEGAEQTRG